MNGFSLSCRLAGVALLMLVALPFGSAARAQGFGFFGNLFGGLGQQQQGRPSYPGYGGGYGYNTPRGESYDYERPRRRAPRRVPVESAAREVAPKPVVVKHPTLFVAVFGGAMAQTLAGGLDDALATRTDVGVERATRSFSGLTESDVPDLQKKLAAGLAEETAPEGGQSADKNGKAEPASKHDASPAGGRAKRLDVAVVMVGADDRKPITIGGKTEQFGSADWKAAYAKRVAAVDEFFREKKIALVWVGLPTMKDDDFSDDMAALNEIYRDAAAKYGATYVDTWEAFSDDDGDFSSFGPDINGQTVRLRSSDGINFTKAGARKLAHFVEAHVSRALEGKVPTPELPVDPASQTPAKVASRPVVGPVHSLNDLPSSPAGTLAQVAAPTPSPASDGTAGMSASAPPPVNRADNGAWSGGSDNR